MEKKSKENISINPKPTMCIFIENGKKSKENNSINPKPRYHQHILFDWINTQELTVKADAICFLNKCSIHEE